MTDKTLVIKSKLQNISTELGGGETDMSYLRPSWPIRMETAGPTMCCCNPWTGSTG